MKVDPGAEVEVKCPNCRAVNILGNCIVERPVEDLYEGGLQCPDCGEWTHSFWTNMELKMRLARLEQLRMLYKANPTEGRYNTYQASREAYSKDFENFQLKMKHKSKGKEVQPA